MRWRKVPGFERYEVSDRGDIRRPGHRQGRYLKPVPQHNGYLRVRLYLDLQPYNRFVHTLVLSAFVGFRPEGLQCRHLNDVKHDNRLKNLAWGSSKQNTADAIRNKKHARGEDHANAKLTEVAVRRILRDKRSHRSIAREYGVCPQTIDKIKAGLKWKHVG